MTLKGYGAAKFALTAANCEWLTAGILPSIGEELPFPRDCDDFVAGDKNEENECNFSELFRFFSRHRVACIEPNVKSGWTVEARPSHREWKILRKARRHPQ